MNTNEIERYIRIGSGFIEIARDYLPEYPGICRRIYIRKNKLQIDFVSKGQIELNEGESTFYFYYNSLDEAINDAEKFLNSKIDKWINFNQTYELWDFPDIPAKSVEKSWNSLLKDLYEHKLKFPKNFNKFSICNLYAKAVYLGFITTDDDSNLKDHVEQLCSINNFDSY